jgi:hypothetical protein
VIDDGYLAAPEGPLAADLRLNDRWAWIVVALGAAVIAIGGLLLSLLG